MQERSTRTGLWVMGGVCVVVLLGISAAFLLFWHDPGVVRYRVHYPHDITVSGVGSGYFDARYGELEVRANVVRLSDGSLQWNPLNTNPALYLQILDSVIAFDNITPTVLNELGARQSDDVYDDRHIGCVIRKNGTSFVCEFDENDRLVLFRVSSLQRGKGVDSVVQFSWEDGDWFSLPLATHAELVNYMGEPKNIEKHREFFY